VLDDHGERSNTIVELYIGLNHARILDCGDVVHVDVAGELQLRVPDFYYPDLGCWYAYHALHAMFVQSLSYWVHLFEPFHGRLYANIDIALRCP
jgi:hypothetical protein